jgi:hypothetical protein
MPWVDDESGEPKDSGELWKAAQADPRFPPLSNAKPGPHRRGCPQRVLKLYMVMCTQAEADDADRAQAWIESIPPAMVAKHRAEIARLEERYGILFWPRSLMCRQCLGLRYGTHPDRGRESWHRCRARRRGEAIPKWCEPKVPKTVELMKRKWEKRRGARKAGSK